ncbi:AraC family transcriptional regulator, partial [Pseudomonas sp. FW305-3-2-15-E-TSA4]|nr:AraC family transcriptional regulator [Pseudomonas sp. FW305-3-2-15-E-TSA4]
MRPDEKTNTHHPRMLRRALDFIHDNAQYDITIRD